MLLAYSLGLAYLLWVFYILVMGLYRAKLNNRLSKTATVLGAPFLVIGYLLDVATNVTVATAFFWEWPREALVTTRLTRHMAAKRGWRYQLARFICESLLDPFDPTGAHCIDEEG